MEFIDIFGGVALAVFGVRFLRKGLDRLFGGRWIPWLSRMARSRVRAFAAGIAIGTVAPSSTALSLVTQQMLDTGQIEAERLLAVVLGTNVGITVTVQLLAFHIQDDAALFVLAGVVAFQFLRREAWRGAGQCLLALGFVFLAMQSIGQGAARLGDSPSMALWLRLLDRNPLLTAAFAAGFTMLVQSSTSSIGFALALSAGGLFGPGLVLPWVLGANLGIALTGLAVGWGTLEGRRMGTANLIAKLALALPLLLLAPGGGGGLEPVLPGSPARQIALLHTGFNLLVGAVFLPLLGPATRLARFLAAPPAQALGVAATHLDPRALDTPAVALANATRETLRMADAVKAMFHHYWRCCAERDPVLLRRIRQEDDRVDGAYEGIKTYLSRIREGLSEEEARWQFALLTFSNELESVGDIIDRNLCGTLKKLSAGGAELPPDDRRVLAELHERVAARFETAVGLLARHGGGQVQEFLDGKESLNEWCRRAEREHYARLGAPDAGALATSACFLDMLHGFRRVNSHISAIGYAFPVPARRRGPARPRTPAEARAAG